MHARARRGDLLEVGHPEGGLEDGVDEDRPGQAVARLELGEQAVDVVDLPRTSCSATSGTRCPPSARRPPGRARQPRAGGRLRRGGAVGAHQLARVAWVLDDLLRLVGELGDRLEVIMIPKGRGRGDSSRRVRCRLCTYGIHAWPPRRSALGRGRRPESADPRRWPVRRHWPERPRNPRSSSRTGAGARSGRLRRRRRSRRLIRKRPLVAPQPGRSFSSRF